MKKIIVGVFLITLLCSCHQENALKRRNIETDSIVADSSVRLTDDANSPECSIHLNIQYIKTKGENLLNTAFLKSGIMLPDYMEYSNGDGIRKSVDSFVVKYIATKVKAMAIAIVVKEKTCHLFNNVMRMVYMIDILKP